MNETDSEGAAPAVPEAAPQPDPLADVPPLSAERLPPNFRKHVDPASPVPIRGMAAKGSVPLSPQDMCHCLAMLGSDPDPGIAASARKTAAGLPDKILSAGLREEDASPRVLHFFAEALVGKDLPIECIALNSSAHDRTIASIAATSTSTRILEIVANNQLRILRSEEVLRALLGNPSASAALVALTCDFAVRNGLCLTDIPAMIEAHIRIHGAPPAHAGPELSGTGADTAKAIMEEYGEAVTSPSAPPMEEGKRLNLTQRIARMSVSERIKLATLGNKEARGILMRDPNKLVSLAVIHSPRITDAEVLMLATSKTCPDDVLRIIYRSRDWTRQYPIKLALVKNPKVPLAKSMSYLATLREAEVRDISTNKNVPSAIRLQAKKMVDKKVTS